jgi:MFS transporter, DHA2 family, multidrug resistance protein
MAASSDEHVSLRTWIAVLGTILGAFMAVLDIQITNASLREITGGIGSTAVEASCVSTSYLIGEIITIPLWLAHGLLHQFHPWGANAGCNLFRD